MIYISYGLYLFWFMVYVYVLNQKIYRKKESPLFVQKDNNNSKIIFFNCSTGIFCNTKIEEWVGMTKVKQRF